MSINQIFCEEITAPVWADRTEYALDGLTDVWRVSVEANQDKLELLQNLLDKDERTRAARYHHQRDRVRFIVGRGVLRMLLGKYLGCLPEKISFSKGLNNKPFLASPVDLHFNVSYSGNWIVMAFSDREIGVDVEYVNEDFDYSLVMQGCFTDEEIRVIESVPRPVVGFFRSWTRKEALLKATSIGLNDHLKEFSCLDGFQPALSKLGVTEDWRIKSFLTDEGYYISLAQKTDSPTRYYDVVKLFNGEWITEG